MKGGKGKGKGATSKEALKPVDDRLVDFTLIYFFLLCCTNIIGLPEAKFELKFTSLVRT